jgi:hypothetical protein
VKNLWKALLTVAACAGFSTPAAAQISGFVSLDGPQFGARIGLNYAANLNSTTTLSAGLRYNLYISPAVPSDASVFLGLRADLSPTFSVGARVIAGLSDIGAGNSFSLTLRPAATLLLLSSNTFAVAATLTLNAPVVPAFALQPWLAVDATYLSGPLQVDFGAEVDFTVVPGFSFDGLYGYVHAGYQLSDRLGLFGGAGFAYAGGTFGLSSVYGADYRGVYGGVNFGLSNAITLRGVVGYFNGFTFTVTAAFSL